MPVAIASWPLEPDRLVSSGSELLDQRGTPLSLRERERREWVTGRVERLYSQGFAGWLKDWKPASLTSFRFA